MLIQEKQLKLDLDNLKNFQKWQEVNGADFSLWDYMFRVSKAELAIALSTLFWPDFIEYEGGVFLAQVFNLEVYYQWKKNLDNDLTAIERVLNHQHIDDLFSGSEKVGINNLAYLGQVIAQMWESRLKSLYPSRHFEVICNRDEQTVVVTFYQI
jgi:hypothetical protein